MAKTSGDRDAEKRRAGGGQSVGQREEGAEGEEKVACPAGAHLPGRLLLISW